ncbi:MAG: ATP-dependent DNA helicase RecG [Ruminiclostridium sp.]|nr:ATP-dependent DNA helicase RecG [Ruminiclostridium sp.]
MNLDDDITHLKGVGEKRSELFEKLGINTIEDLLHHFPRDYVDFTSPVPIAELNPDETSVFSGYVSKKIKPYFGPKYSIFKLIVSDENADILITIYNSQFTFDKLILGKEYIFYGKISGTILAPECQSPVFIDATEKNLLSPKYNLTKGLSAAIISKCIKNALDSCNTEDLLPEKIKNEFDLIDYHDALNKIHFPNCIDELKDSRRRLAFEELLVLQLGLKLLKSKNRTHTPIVMVNQDISDFYSKLPFKPTNAQLRSINECIVDMQGEVPMNRLLQGDVGSGKTLVAAAVCYFASKNGYQSALMAPTEILAKQHYNTLKSFLEPLGINVVLLTGSTKIAPVYKELEDGSADVAVGTQALIQKNVKFKELGLVITDEQHRFGVEQRSVLSEKGMKPHTLVMSATPIPRTLALIIYGDLEISVLDEMPKGRMPIKTYGVNTGYRERIYKFIKKYVENGFQAYIVCPLIEEGASEKASAVKYFETLNNKHFSNIPTGLLHGKMKQSEKDNVMQKFKNNEIKVLVSTTVIEVGVDVPNAVIMVIENAEQFGLSQLHQLRGRVGRGTEQSHCILITDNNSEYTKARIDTMVRTSDGFEIANEDLRLRGPGDFFGSKQHGLPELKIADMSSDIDILQETKLLSEKILKEDPKLTKEDNKGLRKLVTKLFNNNKN